jgi:hypothetical protein
VALNRVHSDTGVCFVQSAVGRRVVTFRVVCRKHGKYLFVVNRRYPILMWCSMAT